MPWKVTDVKEERIKFVVRAVRSDRNMSELCRDFGVSRSTGYRWVRRYRETKSLLGLEEKSRKPHSSPSRTSEEQEMKVVELRKRYGWGAKKLEVLLRQKDTLLKVITINRILKRRDMIEPHEIRHGAVQRFERSRPNELWQMDFKGESRMDGGWCHPLSLLDDHSRFAVGLHALARQDGTAVHQALRRTFDLYGLPEAMLMDHGIPWWSTTNGYGLTWLSVDLIKQDIQLIWGAIRHPQTQGKVERFHRTLKEAMDHRGKPKALSDWQQALDDFRNDYNHLRPHEALGMEPPAARYQPSPRAYNPHPHEWEYPRNTMVRRLSVHGCLCWHGHYYFVCEALAGQQIGIEEFDDNLLVSFRNMYIREIHLRTRRTLPLVLPVQNRSRLVDQSRKDETIGRSAAGTF